MRVEVSGAAKKAHVGVDLLKKELTQKVYQVSSTLNKPQNQVQTSVLVTSENKDRVINISLFYLLLH